MADCLERPVDGQTISRDDFFNMHKTDSGLIGSSSLCVSTLSGVLAKKSQDSLKVVDDLSPSEKIVKTDLLNCPDEIEISSDFLVLRKDCSNSDSSKQCNDHLAEQLKDEDSDGVEVSNDTSVALAVSTDKSDSCILPTSPAELDQRKDNSDSLSQQTNKLNNEPDKIGLNIYSSISQNSLDSDCSVELNSGCETEEKIEYENPLKECSEVETMSDVSTSETVVIGSSLNVISLSENEWKAIAIDGSCLTIDPTGTLVVNTDEDSDNLDTNRQNSDEQVEMSRDYLTEVYSTNENLELDISEDVAESDRSRYLESSKDTADSCVEIVDVKPDIHEISICQEDLGSITIKEELYEPETITDDITPEDFSDETVSVSVESDVVSDDLADKERLNAEKCSDSDICENSVMNSVQNEPLDVEQEEFLKSKETIQTCKDFSSRHSVILDSFNIKSELAIDRPEESFPVRLKNSKCTIQLVPKGERKCLQDKERCKRIDKGNGVAGRLESLTGTVKIGCLSVTPLHPCLKKGIKEELKDEPESAVEPNDQVEVTDDESKTVIKCKDPSILEKNESIYLKKEHLLKNKVDITISPRSCESGVDAVETLKVKIPRLIESFTGRVVPEKQPLIRQEHDKNFIVNKNLKIIESFLMQKGFEKEATILKEKTDIIKPYLEDIALKMEKSINELNYSQPNPDVKDSPITEFKKFMNSYNNRNETLDHDKSVEKELAALTEKFLNSSVVSQRNSLRRLEGYSDQMQNSLASSLPNCVDKDQMYDRYYGKTYYEGLDYLMNRDPRCFSGRSMEPCMSKVYRSSRHDIRESDCGSELSMYDQFLPEFDNKVHPMTLMGTPYCFSHSDFSQFIDECTAEKYNNFIHFMVSDMEALSFDMMDYKRWRESRDANAVGGGQLMNCCVPTLSPMNQFYPPGPGQYGMMSQAPLPTIPSVPSHAMNYQMSPAMGRPLPMDSSKESCSQLTITPLDESGKPYGPVPLPPDPCSQGLCNDSFSCGAQSLPSGLLPSMPPSLVPIDSVSQQLTITPLHQSSSLPYLHRSADSANRRRGRPPMDPEYGAVGYRKDTYANVKFSRADFMARVKSNIDPSCLDARYLRTSRVLSGGSVVENQPVEAVKYGQSVSSVVETDVLPPAAVAQESPSVKIQPIIASYSSEMSVSTPTSLKLGDPVTKPPVKTTVPDLSPVSAAVVLPSNGYKKTEPINDKQNNKSVEIVSKQTKIPEPKTQKVPRTSFQITSKQVKIVPEKLLTNSNVKISLVDKKSPIPDTSNKVPKMSTSKTDVDEKLCPELSGILKKNIPGLKTVLKNSNITLKTVQVSSGSIKRESSQLKTESTKNEIKKESTVSVRAHSISSEKEVAERDIKNVSGSNVDNRSIALAKHPEGDNSTNRSVAVFETKSKKTVDPKPDIQKETHVKAKKRKQFPLFKKKKKRPKVPAEVQKKMTPRKVIDTKRVVHSGEKSNTHNSHPVKRNEKSSKESGTSNNTTIKGCRSEPLNSPDMSNDGVRRSGRKRKIIEGNPKFRDMERVDLKYFREERLKPGPTKRKSDTKANSKHENTPKKRILSDQKTPSPKEQNIVNDRNKKHIGNNGREEEAKTKEKLQQFLEIAIPNNTRVNCLAWSSVEGWLAVGGDDGLLKVLKLDSAKDSKGKNLAAPANLSMNQTMEGHSGSVQVITWNEQHQKLTTSDQTGLIIVWTLYKGTWYEEMINNRNKSVVKGMVWNSDGLRICIVYEDGAVIVGSVDGNRIWGKELKGLPLCGVQWSPDSRLLIFALKTGEIHVYDSLGNFITKVVVVCLPSVMMVGVCVVGLAWYDGRSGYQESNCPCLVICFQTGHAQIMRRYNDENPVIVETGFNVTYCSWNHNGSILAIAGTTVLADEMKETNIVQFYTPYGEHLRSLKVPGKSISCSVWEGGSLRMALAVDSFIYFAIIRPDYKWCYFSETVVYSYNKPSQSGTVVTFWDIRNPAESNVKCLKALFGMAACREHCVLAAKADDTNGKYCLLLCNSIATTVDSKFMEVEPLFVTMNSSHVFAASKDHFIVWPFMTPKSHSTLGTVGSKYRKERIYHIDDTPSGVAEVILDLDENYQPPLAKQEESGDPVCCICCSDKVLLIGRESGSLQRYSLPQVALVQRYSLSTRPHSLDINSDSTKVAVVDMGGSLTLVDLTGGETVVTERKDVWSLCWAKDNPSLMAIMEKTRMYVLKGTEPEEPIMSSAYIASFNELEIRAILLDEILSDPESPSLENHILDLEVKSLRDTRQLLDKIGLPEATAFIEQNPHPRLWRLLAEAAVKKLDFETAESAFVRCSDYAGIQLVKRLASIASEPLQKAQVAAYFGDFNEAERLYLETDRRDLAISLREKLGDWFRVLQLMKSGGGGTDSQYHTAYNSIAHHFAETNNWESAKEYYEKAKNTEKLIKCYQMLEDYEALEQCAAGLPDKYPLLKDIAEIFLSVGMCSQAVTTFIKCGLVERGVEGCISLSEWDQAVALAESHSILPHIADRLDQAASSLLEKGKHFDAIQLYRKANRFLDAANLMFDLAKEEGRKKVKPLRLKKLYVLAALLVEEHNNHSKGRSSALLDKLEGGIDIQTLDNAWRGAEAYHFLMLAQRQLYEGYHEAAMMTTLYLKSYEDILPTEEIYCLLALACCGSSSFGTASKAFMKLESLVDLSDKEKEEYADLAMDIFTRNVPKDVRANLITCPTCSVNINPWSGTCRGCETRYPACIVTGRPVTNLSQAWSCPSCSHPANHSDINIKQNCPLCHSPRLSS